MRGRKKGDYGKGGKENRQKKVYELIINKRKQRKIRRIRLDRGDAKELDKEDEDK